jgi:hypothetical protein
MVEIPGYLARVIDSQESVRRESVAVGIEWDYLVSLRDVLRREQPGIGLLHALDACLNSGGALPRSFRHEVNLFPKMSRNGLVQISRTGRREAVYWGSAVDVRSRELKYTNIGFVNSEGIFHRYLILFPDLPLAKKDRIENYVNSCGLNIVKGAPCESFSINGGGFKLAGFKRHFGVYDYLTKLDLGAKEKFVYFAAW